MIQYDESSNAQKIANYENYILNEKDALDMISDIPCLFRALFISNTSILISKYVRNCIIRWWRYYLEVTIDIFNYCGISFSIFQKFKNPILNC